MKKEIKDFIFSKNTQTLLVYAFAESTRLELVSEIEKSTEVEVEVFSESLLSVDTAREIGRRIIIIPSEGKHKVFILAFSNIFHEAQNALLKVLEEPRPNVSFLLVSGTSLLLPTILSRVSDIVYADDTTYDLWAKTFIKSDIAKRLEEIKKLVEDENLDVSARLIAIEKAIPHDMIHADTRKVLISLLSFARIRGASAKMLLETVALNIDVKA